MPFSDRTALNIKTLKYQVASWSRSVNGQEDLGVVEKVGGFEEMPDKDLLDGCPTRSAQAKLARDDSRLKKSKYLNLLSHFSSQYRVRHH